MTCNPVRNLTLMALTALALSACAADMVRSASGTGSASRLAECNSAAEIGRFAPSTDLLIANFDNKPDTDDLHAIAGLATMLRDPRFSCVRYVATTGAYGPKNPEPFIEAGRLMTLAFGKAWADAHADRAGAAAFLADRSVATLRAGGDVWIMEAGQSDLTAATIRRIAQAAPQIDLRAHLHVVQHSRINEYLTDAEALKYVREQTDYIEIADGNERGNGTPGFKTSSPTAWSALLGSKRAGAVWAEARRLANVSNPVSSHPNKAIADGGFDFSDLAEGAYIFGFESLPGVEEFAAEFAGTSTR